MNIRVATLGHIKVVPRHTRFPVAAISRCPIKYKTSGWDTPS